MTKLEKAIKAEQIKPYRLAKAAGIARQLLGRVRAGRETTVATARKIVAGFNACVKANGGSKFYTALDLFDLGPRRA